MTKRIVALMSLLITLLVLACTAENDVSSDCEPCPSGFTCRLTPFGTSDCIPDNSAALLDGGLIGIDMQGGLQNPMDLMVSRTEDMGANDGAVMNSVSEADTSVRSASTDQTVSFIEDAGQPVDMMEDQLIVDSPPTPTDGGNQPSSRIIRLDVPSSSSSARLAGCQVVGRNAGSGLAGVFAILGTNLTDQLQANSRGHIPLVVLSRFLDWPAGMTAGEYGTGTLEFYLGYDVGDGVFGINEASYVEGSRPPVSKIRFESTFAGKDFETNSGAFMLETASFSLPFLVELELAWLDGEVSITTDGVAMTQTTLNGYLSFSSVRRIVMAIQSFCNDAPNDLFCEAANRFLDGDPSTPELDGDTARIARDVILPLMRNLDVRLEGDQALECDAFCEGGDCVECNAVSVCAVLESEPVEIR